MKAKKPRGIELKMIDRIAELENNLEDKNNNYEEYLQLKAEWEHMLAKKNNGIMIRAKGRRGGTKHEIFPQSRKAQL